MVELVELGVQAMLVVTHQENGGSVFCRLSRLMGDPKPQKLSRRDISQKRGA